VIAVLPSISTSDTSSTIVRDRADAFTTVVDASARMNALLLGDVIGTGVNDADLAINADMSADGPNDLMRNSNSTCKRQAASAAFAELSGRSVDGPVDILSALRTLEAHLVGLPRSDIEVVLMSSMLNTSTALNLDDPAAFSPGIDSVVTSLSTRGLLPDCRGWHVYAIGAGRTPTGGLDGERNEQLRQFWSSLFTACGGSLVVYDTSLASFPIEPVAGSALPPGAGPAVVTVEMRGPEVVTTVPANVLFDVGRAELRPDADNALEGLLRETVARHPEGHLTIVGYTDAAGTPEANLLLSRSRADAVSSWLVAHGVAQTQISTDGKGEADPVGDNATDEGRRQNRRVQLTVTPA
jgi:outer membrane protein OmpA-like peptidoglycan-associated protein